MIKIKKKKKKKKKKNKKKKKKKKKKKEFILITRKSFIKNYPFNLFQLNLFRFKYYYQ